MTAPSTNTDNKTGSKDSNETNQQPGVKNNGLLPNKDYKASIKIISQDDSKAR
jgi:hypothetical protein